MSDFRNANITITSNNTQSIQQTNLLSQSVSTLRKEILNVNTAIDKSTKSWTNLSLGYNAVIDLSKKAADSLKSVYQIGKEAAQLQEVSKYTELMASKAGLDFDKLVDASRRGANGMATNAEVMKSNLKALRSGLKASENDFGSLWKIADAMSDQMGVSITQAFEQITTAIVTGNQKSLISMGIMPESFGKVSDAADLLTRRSETLKLVLSELGPQAEEVGNQGDTAADKFTQFETSLNNLKQNISEKFLPTSIALVDWLKDVVEWGGDAADTIEWMAKGNAVFDKGQDVSKLGVSGQIEALKQQKSELQKQKNAVFIDLYSNREGTVAGAFTFQSTIDGWKKEYKELSDNIADIDKQIADLEKNGIEIVRTTQEAAKAAERQAEATQKAADEAERKKRADKEAEEIAKRHREEMEKQLLALSKQIDSGLNEALGITNKTLSESIVIMNAASMAALGFCGQVDKTAAAEYKLSQEAEKMADEFFKAFENANKLEESINNIGRSNIENSIKELKSGNFVGGSVDLFSSVGLNVLGSASLGAANLVAARGTDDVKTTSKNFWSAIKSDYGEAMAAAMAQGIIDSNLGEALRSTIGSIAASKASSYGSTLLSGLFSGNGFAGLGGAVSGFVGSLAVGAIANSLGGWWDSISKDKHKGEVLAANAETQERVSKAWLNTYSVLLNPFLSSSDVQNIYDARYNPSNKYTISHEWKDTDWHWLTGQSTWRDTTPQSTFDTITRLESAINLANENSDRIQKEIELLETKGYSYQALSMSMDYLSEAFSRSQSIWENPTFSWDDGKKFSVDLSDSIQELTKAYYDALKQYGQETASINTRNSSQYLAYAPFISELYGGTYYPDFGSSRVNMRAGGYGGVDIYDTYDIWGDYADIFKYNRFEEIASDYYEGRNANKAMLEMVKNVGENQYNLAALQINDPVAYAEEYLSFLEKQMNAAAYIMEQQEYIYADASKTFEEQSAALEMYQQAQDSYYNAKLEMLSAEQAKEEQIRKEEQQAALRRQEQMEALLGFTGEIARTGNNVYILEGADQVGALKEMIQQYGDNPEALAALQAMLSAAQSKAKFGKIA